MISKTFKGGLTFGGAEATIKYLLDERISLGTSRVLFGDSEITLALIKEASKKQKWSWSSGVLSFSETLDDKTKRGIISDFERVFFAGLSQDQFNILWVNHEDKNRTELHYIAPRMELSKGKSFNPYFVQRDFNKKDLWQEKMNLDYGLSSHLDNLKAVSEKKAMWAKDKKSLLKQIDEMIIPLIKSSEINSRNDIISKLRENFELGNVESKFLEIIDESGKTHRLKGTIYSKDFTDFHSLYNIVQERKKVTANKTPRNHEAINRSLNEIVEKQSYANRKKYGTVIEEKIVEKSPYTIKLDQTSHKKAVLLSSNATDTKTLDKEKNNKKEKTNDRIRSTINRLLRRSGEEARRRAERIYESIRISRKLLEDIKQSAGRDYQSIKESLEIWARERRYREDFKTLFLGIENLTQQFELNFTERNREVERRLAERNTAIIELIQNRLNPEDKLVEEQRVKNAKKRGLNKVTRKENKPTLI